MPMEFTLPVFVREKDSGKVTPYSSIAEMQNQLEQIDVANKEYEAWDAGGVPLSLTVGAPPRWLQIEAFSANPKPAELAFAIQRYADSYQVKVDLSPLDRNEFTRALQNVRGAIDHEWRSMSWWKRFRSRF
jgi:hypothetical protein